MKHCRTARRFAHRTAWLVIAAALAVLVLGWFGGLDPAIRLAPHLAAMVPTTTLCFALLAGKLAADRKGAEAGRIGRRGALLAALGIAAVNLAMAAAGLQGGIDAQLPFVEFGPDDAMSPATALCFFLAAAAMLLRDDRRRAGALAFTGLATAGLIIALLDIVAHIFGTRSLHDVWIFSTMALHTAILFALLFAAILASRPTRGWMAILTHDGPGGTAARRLLPLALLAPLVFGIIVHALSSKGLFDADFRLSLLSVCTMTLMGVAVMRSALIETRAHVEQQRIQRALAEAVQERDDLLVELRHRIKNNLQQMISLISFEERSIAAGHARSALGSLRGRVRALGVIHELLLTTAVPSHVEMSEFLDALCEAIDEGQGAAGRGIRLEAESDRVFVPMEVASSLGLIVNELVANACKHAFVGRDGAGRISVGFDLDAKGAGTLRIGDDGSGLPAQVSPLAHGGLVMPGADGLGIGRAVVSNLAHQLHAELSETSGPDGTTVLLRISAMRLDAAAEADAPGRVAPAPPPAPTVARVGRA